MNIQSISRDDEKVAVTLSADELTKLADVLSNTDDKNKDNLYHNLYSDILIAKDLCRYGEIDSKSLSHIVKCRSDAGEEIDSFLSDEDIAVFNAYIEDNDMPIAFGNSDWRQVYRKIVGSAKTPEKIENWIGNAWQTDC